MRGDQDETAAVGQHAQQMLVALDARQQPLGPGLATVGADEIGEADREVAEHFTNEALASDGIEIRPHARDVVAHAGTLGGKPARRTAGERPRQGQAGRPRQRPGEHGARTVDGRPIQTVGVPARRPRGRLEHRSGRAHSHHV
jgi:hypothetical protein